MKNNNSSFPVVPFLAVGAVVVGGLLLARFNAPPRVPVSVIAGIDASESVRVADAGGGTQLGQSRSAVARLGAGLQAGSDHLAVVRVDRAVNEFYCNTAPTGSEEFLRLLMQHTQTPATQGGTYPAKFWTLAARRAADWQMAPGRAVAIGYWGDADNDDLTPQSREEIAAAATQLAANPRVLGVWIYGAKATNWGTLRELFAPMGARLHLATREQMAPSGLLDSLDEARRKDADK